MSPLLLLVVGLCLTIQETGEQVSIQPSGPVIFPIGESRTINCTTKSGTTFVSWNIFFKNMNLSSVTQNDSPLPGVTAVTQSGLSVLTLNTSYTNITAIACIALQTTTFMPFSPTLNVTIYGILNSPNDVNIFLNDNSLMASWDYRIIPTVSVHFTITLTFLSPSQLKNITEYVTDTDSFNFTLEGVRSCDPFTMCITATNIVGQSQPSCVNKTLPYIPSTNDIEYSLVRVGDSYSLNITIQMSDCPLDGNNSLFALLQSQNTTLLTLQSQFIVYNMVSTVIVPGLSIKSVYNLTIISSNSLGIAFSESQQFCTNDIDGVHICSTMMTGIYKISCDYIIGCNYSGCSYELTSTNDNINGFIIGKNYEIVSIDVNTQYNLTVTDINGDDVTSIQQLYVHFISLCLPVTGAETTTFNSTSIDYNSLLITSVIVGVLVPILIITVVLVASVTFVLLFRNDKFPCRTRGKSDARKTNPVDVSLQYDNNVSYGVVNVISTPPTDVFTCETNRSYDFVKKKDHSTVSSQSSPTPLYESVQ